jgi:hypothetical protein
MLCFGLRLPSNSIGLSEISSSLIPDSLQDLLVTRPDSEPSDITEEILEVLVRLVGVFSSVSSSVCTMDFLDLPGVEVADSARDFLVLLGDMFTVLISLNKPVKKDVTKT